VLGYQPAGQPIAHLAGPVLTLLQRHQAILPVGPKHAVKRLARLNQELRTLAANLLFYLLGLLLLGQSTPP